MNPSTVKYSQAGQTDMTSLVNQHPPFDVSRWTIEALRSSSDIFIPNIKTSRQICSLTITTKSTFCQLPTTCFRCQLCTNNTLRLRLLSSLKLRQTKYTTGDSCDGGVCVLNHSLSWFKFVNVLLYHSKQWFNVHVHVPDNFGKIAWPLKFTMCLGLLWKVLKNVERSRSMKWTVRHTSFRSGCGVGHF